MPRLILYATKQIFYHPTNDSQRNHSKSSLESISYEYFPRESKYSCMKINKKYLPETKNFEQFLQKELFDNPLDFTNIVCIYNFPEINNFET